MTSLPDSRLAHMSPSLDDMASRVLAEHASSQRTRTIVALAGPPAAGKSTLSESLCETLNALEPGIAVVVPMDGYHYDNAVLAPQGLLYVKGAPETFDARGLYHDLVRVRTRVAIESPMFATVSWPLSTRPSRQVAPSVVQSWRAIDTNYSSSSLNTTQ